MLTVLDASVILVALPIYVNRYSPPSSNYSSLVLCLGAFNGAIRWQRPDLPQAFVQASSVLFGLAGDPRGLPAIAANGDIAVDAGGYLSFLNAATGATLYSVPLSSTAVKRGLAWTPRAQSLSLPSPTAAPLSLWPTAQLQGAPFCGAMPRPTSGGMGTWWPG